MNRSSHPLLLLLLAPLVAGLLLAGCGGAPTPSPTASVEPVPVEQPISAEGIRTHLAALQRIADENDGIRAMGTPGYEASVEYVREQLEAYGYQARVQEFDYPTYAELPGGFLEVGGQRFEAGPDLHAFLYAPSGEVTAPVVSVGYPDSPAGEGQQGCSPDDFAQVPRGAIVIAAPGPCYRRDEVRSAQRAGAAAIVVAYAQWEPGQVRRPTLLSPEGIDIPGVAATGAVGEAMRAAAAGGGEAHLVVRTEIGQGTLRNVLAETKGPASRVIMLGAHLDSALDGPGINDNGSGVAAVLEIARVLADERPAARVRVAFWGGEELGTLGSRDYVEGISPGELRGIKAYLNLDMVGSPNFVRFIYADDGSDSAGIGQRFAAAFDELGVPAEPLDLGGGSDHFAFLRAGIPVGGLFSGATEEKTDAQAQEYGGTAAAPLDACYHLACDTLDNVDTELAAQLANVTLSVALALTASAR